MDLKNKLIVHKGKNRVSTSRNFMTENLRIYALGLFSVLTFSQGAVQSATYQIWNQSANSLGYAHADMAALADDASTAWYNPAGMTRLCRPEFSFGGTAANIQTSFNGDLGFETITDVIAYLDANLFGAFTETFTRPFRTPRAVGNTSPVSGFFNGVYPLQIGSIDVALGLSVVSPWGWETDWRYSSVNSYATRTSIASVQINPSLAVRYDQFSFGIGFGEEFIRAEFFNNFGVTGDYVNVSGWKPTWNIGGMYEFSFGNIGLTYRPSVSHHLKGNSAISINTSHHAHLKFKVPSSLMGGITIDINPCWTVMSTIGWNHWDVKKLDIVTGIPLSQYSEANFAMGQIVYFNLDTSRINIPFRTRDTFFAAIGSKYQASDNWALKWGLAYDQSPIRSRDREFRFPDSDHYIVAVGARYDFNSYVRTDIGFQYIYVPKTGIHNQPVVTFPSTVTPAAPINLANGHGYKGSITTNAVLFAIQATVLFP
jgi:long-chain fatty acid transport protein